MSATVFASYAPKDRPFWEELEKHLRLLQRAGDVQAWSHAEVGAGEDWRKVVQEHLDSASVILLLLSADFFASDQTMDVEVERAFARAHGARSPSPSGRCPPRIRT